MQLAEIQALLVPLFPGLMGVDLKEVSPERVVAKVETRRFRAGLPQWGHTGSGDEKLGRSADDRLPHSSQRYS